MNAQQLLKNTEQRLMAETHKTLKEASAWELHNALSGAAMECLAPVWAKRAGTFFPPSGVLSFHGVSGGPAGLQQPVLHGAAG